MFIYVYLMGLMQTLTNHALNQIGVAVVCVVTGLLHHHMLKVLAWENAIGAEPWQRGVENIMEPWQKGDHGKKMPWNNVMAPMAKRAMTVLKGIPSMSYGAS